jgi:hypothetical protein
MGSIGVHIAAKAIGKRRGAATGALATGAWRHGGKQAAAAAASHGGAVAIKSGGG